MVPIPIFSRQIAAAEQTAPKTVLAFIATTLAIIAAATGVLTVGLAAAGHGILAASALGGGFVLFASLLVWVVAAFQKDPSRLVLGPMTGREFLEYQRWTAGDSVAGEQIETVGEAVSGLSIPSPLPALPKQAADEGDMR